MKKLNIATESKLRDHIEILASESIPEYEFFRNPVWFSSDKDYLSYISQNYDQNFPIKYLMLSYSGFKDSRTNGCEEDPDVFVFYKLQMFRRYFQDEDDNSHDELIHDMITFRTKVLNSLDIEKGKTILSFSQSGAMVNYTPSEHIIGVFGDWFNFEMKIEVTNE